MHFHNWLFIPPALNRSDALRVTASNMFELQSLDCRTVKESHKAYSSVSMLFSVHSVLPPSGIGLLLQSSSSSLSLILSQGCGGGVYESSSPVSPSSFCYQAPIFLETPGPPMLNSPPP